MEEYGTHMVSFLAKNSKAGCLFRPNFLKQVVIEIQKMEHPIKNFQSTTSGHFVMCFMNFSALHTSGNIAIQIISGIAFY